MSDEIIEKDNNDDELSMENTSEEHSEYKPADVKDESVKHQLTLFTPTILLLPMSPR